MLRKGVVVTPDDFRGVDWIEKMKSLGLDTLGIHSGGGPGHDVVKTVGNFASAGFRRRAADAGINLEYENHSVNMLLDRSLFAVHPEYFRQDFFSGKREENGNWCVSNPEFRGLLGENARKLASTLPPSTHRHFFWSGDFAGGWCHCPGCAPLTAEEQNLLSMNTMIRELRKDDPRAELAYLAYMNHGGVPERVRPEEGIFLEFAPWLRCPRHAVNDPECAVNRVIWNSLGRYLKIFDPAKTKILEYWLDVSLFSGYRKPAVRPVFSPEVLLRDLDAYTGLGIRDFTTFAVYMDGDYFSRFGSSELEAYAEILNRF